MVLGLGVLGNGAIIWSDIRRFLGLVYVRGVLCVGTVLLFGTGLISRFSAFLTRLEWPSSCSARETMVNLGYVTRGLGLLLFG